MILKTTAALLAVFGLFAIFACGSPADERDGIRSAIVDMFVAVDERDWPTVKAAFTESVRLDYESMTGQAPEDLTPDNIVAAWSGFLPGFDHTHHQLGNFRIESAGDRARARFYGTATHNISGAGVWTVVGGYEVGLIKSGAAWRIDSLRLEFKYADGNLQLAALARDKTSQRSKSPKRLGADLKNPETPKIKLNTQKELK